MAEKTSEKVRYRVLKPVFVNDTFIDPKDPKAVGIERRGKNVFVMAPPGLEGSALELAKGKAAEPEQSGAEGST